MGTNEQDTLGALEHLISLLPSHDADSSASSSTSSARRSRVFFGPRLRVGRRVGPGAVPRRRVPVRRRIRRQSALRVFQQSAGGPIDLGNQLSAPFMTLLSSATSTSASNPQWDFDVLMEPTFFSVTESYFLEATLELTFANTGPLTRKLVLPLARRANQSSLRSALSDASRTELVAITGRAPDARVEEQGVRSNKFAVRAAAATSGAEAVKLQAMAAAAAAATLP